MLTRSCQGHDQGHILTDGVHGSVQRGAFGVLHVTGRQRGVLNDIHSYVLCAVVGVQGVADSGDGEDLGLAAAGNIHH